MLRDKVILGAVAGVFANMVMEVPELILWRLKVFPHPLFHYLGSLFMPVDTLHRIYLGQAMGFLAAKIYGAFLGVVFIYLLANTGCRYFLAKGLLYGTFIWLVSFGGLASLPMVKLSSHPRTPFEILLFFLLHLLFGFALGLFVQYFTRRQKDAI